MVSLLHVAKERNLDAVLLTIVEEAIQIELIVDKGLLGEVIDSNL